MSLVEGLLGNSSKVLSSDIQQELKEVLLPDEKVEHAYQFLRDYFAFTNKRLIMVNVQGITGSKVEYHSIPYRSITQFSIEGAGTFDLDAELKICITGEQFPIQKKFSKKISIHEVQRVLASYVLK
jgi:hypothetical protein